MLRSLECPMPKNFTELTNAHAGIKFTVNSGIILLILLAAYRKQAKKTAGANSNIIMRCFNTLFPFQKIRQLKEEKRELDALKKQLHSECKDVENINREMEQIVEKSLDQLSTLQCIAESESLELKSNSMGISYNWDQLPKNEPSDPLILINARIIRYTTEKSIATHEESMFHYKNGINQIKSTQEIFDQQLKFNINTLTKRK